MATENAYSVTLDNLAFMYVGSHCIQTFECYDFTVQNCWFEWIGGSLQGDGMTNHTRYGNAVENWGLCDDFVINNCYAGNVYDSAFTTQYSNQETDFGAEHLMKNVDYSYNVFECCNSAGELFDRAIAQRYGAENLRISNNYVIYPGHGLPSQRPVKGGNIYSGNRYRPFTYYGTAEVTNNYIVYPIISSYTDACQYAPDINTVTYANNVYVLYTPKMRFTTSDFIPGCYQPTMIYPFSERTLQMIIQRGLETGSTYYYTDEPYMAGVAEGCYYNPKTPQVGLEE